MEMETLTRRAIQLARLVETHDAFTRQLQMALMPLSGERSCNSDLVPYNLVTMCEIFGKLKQALASALDSYATTPFEMIVAEATRQGQPSAYLNDLFAHDKRNIEECGDNPFFAWGLHDCGTHFFNCGDPVYCAALDLASTHRVYGSKVQWYLYHNGSLQSMCFDTLAGSVGRIRREMKKEEVSASS